MSNHRSSLRAPLRVAHINEQSDRFRRVGTIEYHDRHTSVLSCLAAFMRFSGLPVRLDHIIDLVPIPETGADDALLARIGRRLGVLATALPAAAPAQWQAHETLMVRNAQGYWFLLWVSGDACFLAGLPGLSGSFRQLSGDSEILGTIVQAYALRKLPFAPRLGRQLRPPKMWLMPWQTRYAGHYDLQAVDKMRANPATRHIKERPPAPLTAFTPEALRASHGSLMNGPSPLHGVYRTINMRRGDTLFVDHRALAASVEILLRKAREHRAASASDAIDFAAKLFADFLSIHPFLNGNRRMAVLLVARYLAPWDLDIDWSRVNSSQHNYWMRCTQRGHFSVLRHGFQQHLIETRQPALRAAAGH